MMDGTTTIQVERHVAERLKRIAPTYNEAIKTLLNVVGERGRYIPIRYEVPASTRVELGAQIPADGIIRTIWIHFPRGCWSLVHIQVRMKDGTRLVPEKEDFVALDNATIPFYPNHPVKKMDEVVVIIENRDSANPHTPSIILELVGGL